MALYKKDNPFTIQSMFNSIATRYDRTNTVLSLGLHKKWNRKLVHQIQTSTFPHTFLDLCCGTGDITFEYLRLFPYTCQAYLIDFCSNMLACAKKKEEKLRFQHQIHYIEADAHHIPLADETVDCTAIAYGIRNVKNPLLCMQEVYRVLKPGGFFGILELTQPSNQFLRLGHRLYLKTILPLFGKLLTDNQEAYQYLCQSIQTFIPPSELKNLLQTCSFKQISLTPLTGGIAHILVGRKR